MVELNGNGKNSIVAIIIQAGAVGIAILAVFFLYKVSTIHIADSTEARRESSIIMTELKDAIQDNTKVTDRLERSLELNAGRGATLNIK